MLSFLKDSMYSNMAPLFIGPNLLIVSREPKVKELLTALRASPQITLLGVFTFSDCVHQHWYDAVITGAVFFCFPYRSVYRRHTAERSGGDEIRKTTVVRRRPGRAGQRADNVDVSHSRPATAPPFPPVCAAAAARQAGDQLGPPRGGTS